ncbi:transcriptional regulator, TetR family [Monaibacterium marinum]|uniref:Transcriptional regulator, TetR family n=1 Tax=Pontivivens marinum TaxID=1690039 RepID=A0A2C9CMV5_9RHOB|nr:TetR/AcrR family transcriptional regulator [Monaibacterium marinum]SOH92510.1 transcriptional regulator, TetR family [Monaibacterium marinum]
MARKSGSSGEKTRAMVEDAAIRLIARYGFAAVSMRQIAREVGVQAGALYLYTPDKQSLLFDIMRGHLVHLLDSWQQHSPPVETPAVIRLERFVRFHIDYHIMRAEKVFISYMELRNLEPENFSEIERLRRDYEHVIEEILTAGVAEGAFEHTDSRLTTMAMIAMLTGVSTWYRDGGRLPAGAIATRYVDMAFRLAGAEPLAEVAE